MRRAAADDFWERVYKVPRSARLLHAQLEDLPGIGKVDLDLAGPLTAVCGLNGAGKTRIVRALATASCDHPLLRQPEVRRRVVGTRVVLKCSTGDTTTDHILRIGNEQNDPANVGLTFKVVWVEPQVHGLYLADSVEHLEGLDEALEQVEAREYTKDQLAVASYVVGRDYEGAQVSEVEIDNVLTPFPYFAARWHGATYGAEDMGLGELCCHFLLWTLSSCPRGTLVLLEEPEAFMIPASQGRFADAMAKIATERQLSIVLTTHSAAILERIPIAHVRVLERAAEGSLVGRSVTSRVRILHPLGLSIPKIAVLLVEDFVAQATLEAILSVVEPDLLASCEIAERGGEANVRATVSNWPATATTCRVVGVLDGDDAPRAGDPEALVRLPSADAPEVFLRSRLAGRVARVSELLGRPLGDVHRECAVVEGRNLHDWLPELSRGLGVDQRHLVRAIVQAHTETEPGQAESGEFVGRLRTALRLT